jgi:hypothetical protein
MADTPYLYQSFKSTMSSPLQREVLTPKKPIWVYKLEQKMAKQDQRIRVLEDALERTSLENRKLRSVIETGGISIRKERANSTQSQGSNGSMDQFSMSL